jgi:hypothetical protein
MAFYGNPAFPLQIHIIEHLILHLLAGDGPGKFQQSVGQSAFTVVNMSYNAKVPDMIHEWSLVVQFGAKIKTNRIFAAGSEPEPKRVSNSLKTLINFYFA